MTREQIKALLPVLTAYAAGESVQIRDIYHKWNDVSEMRNFDLPWRVKPKPREAWVCFDCYTVQMKEHAICPRCLWKNTHPMTHMRSVEDPV